MSTLLYLADSHKVKVTGQQLCHALQGGEEKKPSKKGERTSADKEARRREKQNRREAIAVEEAEQRKKQAELELLLMDESAPRQVRPLCEPSCPQGLNLSEPTLICMMADRVRTCALGLSTSPANMRRASTHSNIRSSALCREG